MVAFAACNSLALYTPEVCSLCPVQLDIGMLDDKILDSNNIIVIWMAHVANFMFAVVCSVIDTRYDVIILPEPNVQSHLL